MMNYFLIFQIVKIVSYYCFVSISCFTNNMSTIGNSNGKHIYQPFLLVLSFDSLPICPPCFPVTWAPRARTWSTSLFSHFVWRRSFESSGESNLLFDQIVLHTIWIARIIPVRWPWCNGWHVRLECGCFSAKYEAVRRKSKVCLACNQDNVSEWSDMSIGGLLFQWASIKILKSQELLVDFAALPWRP